MKKYIISLSCMLIMFAYTLCGGVVQMHTLYAEVEIATSAKSAVIVDYNSGEVIFEKNIEARLPVASMVKLMTILLTCEEINNGNLSLDTKIRTTENASKMGGSQVFIDPYVDYSCEDLLKSVIMASANDASVALAEHISGSESVFVDKMNERAKSLGLNNTLYANCTGLPAPEQYSCAIDCAKILSELVKHDCYKNYTNVWMDELVHPSGRKTELVNTNKLVRYYNGCDCGKTGSTNEAGYCLSASALKNDMRLICVVIGAKTGQDRFKEVSELFNYGFANFANELIVDSSISLGEINIKFAKQSNILAYPKENFYALCKKGNKSQFEFDIVYDENLKAPLNKEQKVGRIVVTNNGKVVKEVDLVIKQEVEKVSYMDNIKTITSNW